MQNNVTAIYRTFAVADLVRDELSQLGLGVNHVSVVPDRDHPVEPGGERTSAEHPDYYDRLHDLHLPEDDMRTYQQAVRNGDYVVSANVDDDAMLDRVKDIMRRPEDAHNLDELDRNYSSATYEPRRDPATAGTYDERNLGRRSTAETSPYLRSYSREAPIRGRGTV